MGKLKEIFTNKPETMSNLVKWVFGLPMAYVAYLILSMLLPNVNDGSNVTIVCQALRSMLLGFCVVFVLKTFLKFDNRFLNEDGKWNHGLFFKGLYVMLIAQLVTNLCLALIFPNSIVKNKEIEGLASNWIFSLFLVVVAAFSEELIFRSYIAWFAKTKEGFLTTNSKKKLIYALVSALLFSIAHFSNPEVDESALWSMLFYFVFGFCLMLCFLKTKGMEFSFGVHVANNIFAAWFVNYKNSVLPTKSLFITTLPISYITVLQALICVVFCSFLCPEKE